MGSLQVLALSYCGLRAVPAFVGELQSLERLELSYNRQIYATLDILIKGCPRLRDVRLSRGPDAPPLTPELWAHLGGFMRKLVAENPNISVSFS